MPLTLYSHPICERHDMGAGHPESPARLRAVREGIRDRGLESRLDFRQAPRVTREALLRVHSRTHVEAIEAAAPERGHIELDPDTRMNPATLEAARRAAGAAVAAVDRVLGEAGARAFCLVRPPGHHAERDRAMGFCFFNNVAVGAAHALAAGLSRVAILDFDVHHGNGTEDIFRDDGRVLFCSTFQHPFYPMTELADRAHLVHSPLPAGAGSADFCAAVMDQWWPAVEDFRPQLLLVSAGFDAHRRDPLAGLRLEEEDYHRVTTEIVRMADRFTDGRVVSTLEGGYDLAALRQAAGAHLEVLLNG